MTTPGPVPDWWRTMHGRDEPDEADMVAALTAVDRACGRHDHGEVFTDDDNPAAWRALFDSAISVIAEHGAPSPSTRALRDAAHALTVLLAPDPPDPMAAAARRHCGWSDKAFDYMNYHAAEDLGP